MKNDIIDGLECQSLDLVSLTRQGQDETIKEIALPQQLRETY